MAAIDTAALAYAIHPTALIRHPWPKKYPPSFWREQVSADDDDDDAPVKTIKPGFLTMPPWGLVPPSAPLPDPLDPLPYPLPPSSPDPTTTKKRCRSSDVKSPRPCKRRRRMATGLRCAPVGGGGGRFKSIGAWAEEVFRLRVGGGLGWVDAA
jgi:hypothetical protein